MNLDTDDLKAARLFLALAAIERNVEPRRVKTEEERARLQANDKSGHLWQIGEEYYSVADLMASRG